MICFFIVIARNELSLWLWYDLFCDIQVTVTVLRCMLSIQAVCGLPRLRAPCIVSFSFSPLFSWCDHNMLASLLWRCQTVPSTQVLWRTHSFVFFAVHETRRIFLSPFISKASKRVSSFFLRVQHSEPDVVTGHTSAFSSRIFVEIGTFAHFLHARTQAINSTLYSRWQ